MCLSASEPAGCSRDGHSSRGYSRASDLHPRTSLASSHGSPRPGAQAKASPEPPSPARSEAGGRRWTGRTEAQHRDVGHPAPIQSGLGPSGIGARRRPGRRRGRGRRWAGRGPALASHAGAHWCLRHRQGGEKEGRRAVRRSPGLSLTRGRR